MSVQISLLPLVNITYKMLITTPLMSINKEHQIIKSNNLVFLFLRIDNHVQTLLLFQTLIMLYHAYLQEDIHNEIYKGSNNCRNRHCNNPCNNHTLCSIPFHTFNTI